MAAKLLSCGLLIVDESGELLIGHSTGNAHWDLPKGLIDAGETEVQCVLRETKEEFGLVLDASRLVDMGRHPYSSGKDLHLFAVRVVRAEINLDELKCTSFFEHPMTHRVTPEVDAYAWSVGGGLESRLAKNMRKLLIDHGVLDVARSTSALKPI